MDTATREIDEAPRQRQFASAWRRARLTVDERVARGRNARRDAPRSSHGRWTAHAARPDPVALLEAQAASRVPELVPIRYGRMLVSPHTFYRGAATIMANDFGSTPRSGVTVQLCGDAHMSNFGLFGTPERRMLFDINDFDETLPGPWEWDLKRLAASFEIGGRDSGFDRTTRRDIVETCVREYRARMRLAARMGSLEAWYEHLEVGQLLEQLRSEVREKRLHRKEAQAVERQVAKAFTRDSRRVLARRVDTVDGERRIRADPPFIVPLEDIAPRPIDADDTDALIKQLLASYRQTIAHDHHPLEEYRYVHAARKIVGVGSVGTRCYILLLQRRDEHDPLILQVKEALPSVLEPFAGASEYTHHGERVVAGQRAMQAASDIFLGWQRITGADGLARDYYVRQLHDWKGSFEIDTMGASGATIYARICAATLARAHAPWGDRIAIAAYMGQGAVFDHAIADFAAAYADQNERDYEALVRAVKAGRIEAQTEG